MWGNRGVQANRLYLKSFLMLMFFSVSFCMIFATAISKSSCVTCTRLSRRAYMPEILNWREHRDKILFWSGCVSTSWSKTCFSASSLHFSARAPSHLLRDLSQVNSSGEKLRFEVQSECSCENAPAVESNLVKFIFLEWILRMSRRASSFGGGNSIFLNKERSQWFPSWTIGSVSKELYIMDANCRS